jgi:hypothetical protein
MVQIRSLFFLYLAKINADFMPLTICVDLSGYNLSSMVYLIIS